MKLNFIFFLLVFICTSFLKANGKNVQISIADERDDYQKNSTTYTISLDNGNTICKKCTDPKLTYMSNYSQFQSSASQSFIFPNIIPYGYILNQIVFTVHGRFNCDNTTQGVWLKFQINEYPFIPFTGMPKYPTGCDCPNCVTSVELNSDFEAGGWDYYDYSSANNLTMEANHVSSFTLSSIAMTFYFTIANPQLQLFSPPAGPTEGGTNITCYGQNLVNFNPNITYNCIFDGNITVNGSVSLGGSILICSSPLITIPGEVSLAIEVPMTHELVEFSQKFIIYEEPTIESVFPQYSTCDGLSNVTVYGTDFPNIPLSCECVWTTGGAQYKIGYLFLNETMVICPTPVFSDSNNLQATLSISWDSAQHTTNSLNFQCDSVISSVPPGSPSRGWIYIVIFFGGVTLFVVTILILAKAIRGRKKTPEPIGTINEASSLIRASQYSKSQIFNQKQGSFNTIDFAQLKLFGSIGKGTFGEVFKGNWNGTEVAVKFLNPSNNLNEEFVTDFYKEVLIMKSLRHPNILQFLGASTREPNICIVIEYMPMGSLYKILHDTHVRKLDFDLLKRMLMDAAKGMNYLHKSDPIVIHRDLKSHNLLVDENWKVKVCDFGLSKILETQSDFASMTACGTPSWTAPEILRNEPYSEKADVYSFGIVLWECISRDDPYNGMAPFQVVLAVGTKGMRPPIPKDCPAPWADLIMDCWNENSEKRPSFDQIIDRFRCFLELHQMEP